MPKAHTFTALEMPLAPRGPPPRPLVRFAAPVLVPLCLHPSASARPCSSKPTAGLSHPLRCINPSVSTCSYAATPTMVVHRPLRCIRRPILVCFRAARPISVPSRLLRCSCAGPIVSASVRFFPSLFREAHNSPLPSASLHQSVRFYMFPCSDAHHSQSSSASQAPGISCPVLSRPLQLLGRGAKSVFNSEASPGIPREASLLNIIIVIIVRARERLPEFFLADCGDEFFEVEWLEVCDVFEFSCAECRDGRGEHR